MSRKGPPKSPVQALSAKLSLLPAAPGVYLYKNAKGKVIYIGKARRLNQRVRSYFQAGKDKDTKTDALVRRIDDLDYIVTDSDADALVLENQLIKEYRPLYNVRLKDDKQYPYIRISLGEPFPRVSIVRKIATDKARYFGPYTDVRAMRETLSFAAGLFQVRTCHLNLPGQTVPRPCLDWQIGRCSAPCVAYDTQKSYRTRVQRLIRLLAGGEAEVLAEISQEMEAHASRLEFEEAARLRDLSGKLAKTMARSRPVAGVRGDCDLCGLARAGQDASGVILRVRRGNILTSHHFLLVDKLERGLEDYMAQLLREYYPRAGDIPGEVLLSHPLEEPEAWQTFLTGLRGARVLVKVPQRGPKRQAVELARANATFKLGEAGLQQRLRRKPAQVTPADTQLQEALDLHTAPATIECFDISTFQGKETVASLVFFKGGNPLKSRYRRFRVRTVEGIDDYASMSEVLDRYYSRLAARSISPADLVVVDGGAGQVSAAREVLARYGFHATELIGLAKREETIHREKGTITLPHSSEALKLLQRVRDEAHRFAITYHRLLRAKTSAASELDLIPGIGKVKRLSLLHHFGSLAAIRSAEAGQLAEVRGLNSSDILRILAFFAGRTGPDYS